MTEERELAFGVVGLGTIGGNLARQAIDEEIRVVGFDVTDKPDLADYGVEVVDSLDELVDALATPRVLYLSLPAGELIDDTLAELVPLLDPGDVVADGGNSFWLDSMARAERLREEDLFFLDAGTSGGARGARNGAAFMVGGREAGVEHAAPIFERLSVDGGFLHTGPPGSGHFVKLVHNGIEFGMLQAIGEGVELLEAGEFDLDLAAVFEHWTHGTVIRSWLVELLAEGLREEPLPEIENYVEDTGEVNWLTMWAIAEEVPIPVISQSVQELFTSRDMPEHTYRAIALMRHGFGQHPFGPAEKIAEKRDTSRIEEL